MLTQTLRRLERDGIVSREFTQSFRRGWITSSQRSGAACLASVNAICGWVSRHLDDIEGARRTFDARTGEVFD